jgi:hypothetical protein
MNKTLRRATIFSLLMILALLVNVTYIQGWREQKLRDDPLNARHFLAQFNRNRGLIMAGGTIIARSRDTGNKDFKYQRVYPDSEVFAPVTGYFAPSGSVTGVESAADGLLAGTDPRLTVQHWFDAIVGKTPQGATVQTTIDPDAQRTTYDALRSSTSRRAAAIAIDVRTGAIKVMASYPSFDANAIAVHDTAASMRAYQRLLNASGSPLIDKAIDENPAGRLARPVRDRGGVSPGAAPGDELADRQPVAGHDSRGRTDRHRTRQGADRHRRQDRHRGDRPAVQRTVVRRVRAGRRPEDRVRGGHRGQRLRRRRGRTDRHPHGPGPEGALRLRRAVGPTRTDPA